MNETAKVALYATGAAVAGAGLAVVVEKLATPAPVTTGGGTTGTTGTTGSGSSSSAPKTKSQKGTATVLSYGTGTTVLQLSPALNGAKQLAFPGHITVGQSLPVQMSVGGVLVTTTYKVTKTSVAPYTAGWTPDCKTVLLDASGNAITGPATNAVSPKTGGTGTYGGHTYTWKPCPNYGGTGASTASTAAPYKAKWTQGCKTILVDASGNTVLGPSQYAVPLSGGTAYFGGHAYTWPPCPYASASGGGGGSVVP